MSKDNTLTKDDLLRFVRGEKPWTMLVSRGVDIKFVDKKIHAQCTGSSIASPSIHDVASGLWRLRSDPEALREWASVVLALSELDMAALNGKSEGERLLEVLWDCSFGKELSIGTWRFVEDLLSTGAGPMRPN